MDQQKKNNPPILQSTPKISKVDTQDRYQMRQGC